MSASKGTNNSRILPEEAASGPHKGGEQKAISPMVQVLRGIKDGPQKGDEGRKL